MGTSFGRGGATDYPGDIVNSDVIVIEGSNMAECHPVAFRWVMQARERGATLIHVDPRFTRTSALADIYAPIRAGSDIAFLGGLINYAIQSNRIAKDYLINYTNAAFIVKDGFKLPEDGLFSGFDGKTYNKETWNYEAGGNVGPQAQGTSGGGAGTTQASTTGGKASSEVTGDQKKAGEEPAKNFERKSDQVSSQPSTPPKGSPAQGGGHQAAAIKRHLFFP